MSTAAVRQDEITESSALRLPPLFRLALCLSALAGLLEGAAFLILQATGGLNWGVQIVPVDPNILWASASTNMLLFLLVAIALSPFALMAGRLTSSQALFSGAVAMFTALGFYAILSVPGRIRERAVIVLSVGLGVAIGRWVRRQPERAMTALRRSLIPVLVLTLLVCGGAAGWNFCREKWLLSRAPVPAQGAPNVLVIVLDTLRADRLGLYGYGRPTSPFLDSYSSKSVVFDSGIANSSWTLPSHATLFTGRLPNEHGAILLPKRIPFPMLAEVMAEAGYATAGFSSNNGALSSAFGLARGFQRWDNVFFSAFDAAKRTVYGRKISKYLLRGIHLHPRLHHMGAPEINRRVLGWLDARPARPFFVFLNYMEMHQTYAPPYDYAGRFSKSPERITPPDNPMVYRNYDWEKRKEVWSDAYDATLAYLDDELRKLFEALESRGLDKNLLVVITSDHGESLGEHDIYDHRNSLYREQIHVPLLIRFPGRLPEGVRRSEPVGLNHVAATITQLAGLRNGIPGHSLFTDASSAAQEREVISELSGANWQGVPPHWPIFHGWVKSMVDSEWHFILSQSGAVELFDWKRDIRESNNLAADDTHRERVERFRARLKGIADSRVN